MRPSIAVALALLATVGPALSSPVASPVVSLDEPSANPTVAGNDVDNNTVTQLAMIGARAPGMDSSQTPRRRAEPTELEGLLARISEEQDLADLQRDMKELQKILETRVQNLGQQDKKRLRRCWRRSRQTWQRNGGRRIASTQGIRVRPPGLRNEPTGECTAKSHPKLNRGDSEK
ncbi:hypothetical protein BC835DRAFT_517337 [Cytidiella melzeri]|nr:hypothetical protein BC835DRAFT_517337 [Cytidiella melzeri]